MRQAYFLLLLLAVLAIAQVACEGTGFERFIADDSAHRNLKGADTDTEERWGITGLLNLKSLFRKTPNVAKALQKDPGLAKTINDPTISKTLKTVASDPAVVKSLNKLRVPPNLETALVKSSGKITEESVKKAGALVAKDAGKWTDEGTLVVCLGLLALFVFVANPIILMGTVFNKSE